MNGLIFMLCLGGALLAVAALGCVEHGITREADAKLFGKVHWSIVGIVGYVLVAATLQFPLIKAALAIGMLAVTLGLVVKAVKMRLTCPLCPIVYAVNFGIVAAVYASFSGSTA